jgi:DNA polymerase III delta subunit
MVRRDRRYVQFLQSLSVGERPAVYVLTGSDDFLKREALRKLLDLTLPPEARMLNYQSFFGGDCRWNDVQSACASSGLFSEKRVVALIGVELMRSGDVSGFREYARRPCESTCLVAMTSGFPEESRRRGNVALKRILAALGAAPGFYVFWKNNRPDCEAWALHWLAEKGKRMSQEALSQVLQSVDHASYEVWNVLEKAAGLVGARTEITLEDVAAVGGAASVGSMEAFRLAVAKADRVRAHRNATKCLSKGTQATSLLWRLNTTFRAALGPFEETGGRAGNWRQEAAPRAIAERLGPEQICGAISLICEAEKGIKGGRLKPDLALEVLINELTR